MTESDRQEVPSATDVPQPLPRLSSGVAGLDEILMGGFVRDGLYVLQGSPGAGKTILANQVCYAGVAAGGRAMYVTLLAEQHERMLTNIGQLSFYDAARVVTDLTYVSAFQVVEREGLTGLGTLLRREIVAFRATILVLDGLLASEAQASDLDFKKLLHDLQILATSCNCTMFLLASGTSTTASHEHTMVDGMIELGSSDSGWRTERHLAVRKFRGSAHLGGRHAMRITSSGIMVWPRTEALLSATLTETSPPAEGPDADRAGKTRVPTGIAELDAMLHGGLPNGSSTLLLGPPGAGKTTFGLQFLSCCTADAPGLLLGFYENREDLLARSARLELGLGSLVEQGIVRIAWQSPSEDLIDRVAAEMVNDIRKRGVKRLLIDGILGFKEMTVHPERIAAFYRTLSNMLRSLDVTVICTMEAPELTGPIKRPPVGHLTPIAENLILLRYVEQDAGLKRLLAIFKVRDSEFEHRFREFSIGVGGIALVDGFAGMSGLLTGNAIPSSKV